MLVLKHSHKTRRRGAVLLVVLAMLALFAVIGLSFVFYAESRATAARIYREAQDINAVPEAPDPSVASLQAIAQLIYDTPDGAQDAGTFSSIRGHSLARAMYGNFYEGNPNAPVTSLTLNSSAYNGVGPVPAHRTAGNEIVNFMWHTRAPGNPNFSPGINSVFDPERTGVRNRPQNNFAAGSRYIGKHISSTYPDLNDVAVALTNPQTGQVIVPSFHRDTVFNRTTAADANEWIRQRSLAPPTVVAANVDWTNATGKFRLMRPRPAEHCYAPNISAFPYVPANADSTYTGDVQNLKGSVYPYLRPDGSVATDASGNPILIPKNDSVWIDTGAAVQIWNGKRIKPLFAFLVMPTNNKVNINASGNTRGAFKTTGGLYAHDSGMGFNAQEINPMKVMQAGNLQDEEYRRLKFSQFGQNPGAFPAVSGGADQPSPVAALPVGSKPRFPFPALPPIESAVDWDGGAPLNAMRMMLPGQQLITFGPASNITLGQSAFALAPRYTAPSSLSRYGNGDGSVLVDGEITNNPYLWNPYLWTTTGTGGRVFSATDLRKMHQKWADDVGATNETLVGQLSPISFGSPRSGIGVLGTSPNRNPANAHRANLTTISNSFAMHSMMPMTVNHAAAAPFNNPLTWPLGVPAPVTAGPNQLPPPANPAYGTNKDNTDFNFSSVPNVNMRASNVANLPPLDLNRKLADYRHALATFVSRTIEQNSAVVGTQRYHVPPLNLNPANLINPLQSAAGYRNWLIANGLWNNATNAPVTSITTVQGVTISLAAFPIPAYATISSLMATSLAEQKASLIAAMNDRHEFAKEIFARLVVATGAPAVYAPWHGYCVPVYALNPLTGGPANAADQPAHDALRYLAQLAANIVDFVDGDDIATTFTWNPIVTNWNVPNINAPADYNTMTNVPPGLDRNQQFTGTGPFVLQDRFVVGTEKTKLVLNEAYCELTNNPADVSSNNATRPLEMRFWLELMNPGAHDVAYGNTANPMNTNINATLFYGTNEQTPIGAGPPPVPYNSYEVKLYRNGALLRPELDRRDNTISQVNTVPADQTVRFAQTAVVASQAGNNFDTQTIPVDEAARINGYVHGTLRAAGIHFPQTVGPVGTRYNPNVNIIPPVNNLVNPVNQGYLVLGPGIRRYANKEYNPVTFTPATPANPAPPPGTPYVPPTYQHNASVSGREPFEFMVSIENQLQVTAGAAPNEAGIAGLLTTLNTTPPGVVVRRLANPYLPPNDPFLTGDPNYPAYDPLMPLNPYLVVDAMTGVQVNDAVRVASNSNLPGATRPGVTPEPQTRQSTTKRHPLGALVSAYQLAAIVPGDVQQALFRHNGATVTDPETPSSQTGLAVRGPVPPTGSMGADPNLLMTNHGLGRGGFDFLPFLDRPLVSQMELLNVPACMTQQLTHLFISGANPNQRNMHLAAWTAHDYNGTWVTGNDSRLYRALELLRVKPWTYATPTGGRVAGKINVNLITDPNILLALADPQSGDYFKDDTTQLNPVVDGIGDAIRNPANLNDPTTVYGRLITARHPTARTMTQVDPVTMTAATVPVPNLDARPLRSLGTTHLAQNGFINAGTSTTRTGVEQTILSRFPTQATIGNPAIPENTRSGIFELPNQADPYLRQQLLRKITNNVTTTSETFEVYMTVGWFEVLNTGPYYVNVGAGQFIQPLLGKEVFKNAPGDLRARYYGIVDRTNLTVNPQATNRQGPKPFYLELTNPMTPVNPALDPNSPAAVNALWNLDMNHITSNNGTELIANYDDGPGATTTVRIRAGQYLRLGYGDHEEWVQVQQVVPSTVANPNPTVQGTGRVIVRRNTGRPDAVPPHGFNAVGSTAGQFPLLPKHPVGSLVTNAQQGNPGPQPTFDVNKPEYQAVLPYFQKLE